jgi:hypothetical protein
MTFFPMNQKISNLESIWHFKSHFKHLRFSTSPNFQTMNSFEAPCFWQNCDTTMIIGHCGKGVNVCHRAMPFYDDFGNKAT